MSSQSQAHLAYLALERLIVTLKLKPGTLVTERRLLDDTERLFTFRAFWFARGSACKSAPSDRTIGSM